VSASKQREGKLAPAVGKFGVPWDTLSREHEEARTNQRNWLTVLRHRLDEITAKYPKATEGK